MARPTPPFDGSCLCGAVQIHVTAAPLLTMACHCRDCQKLTASDYSLTTMFPKDSVTVTGEVITGGLKSATRRHYFCPNCLNFIYSEVGQGSGRINMRSSVLEAASALTPFVEVMTEEKVPWVTMDLPHSFPRFPDSLEALQTLMDEYAAQ